MKIAYIYISIMPLTGVDKKPLQQANALKTIGAEDIVDIYVLNMDKTEKVNGVNYVKYKSCKITPYWDYAFKHNFNRFSVLDEINLDNYDYIILRYPKADASGIKYLKKYNIITEHHANEFVELKMEAKYSKNPLYKLLKHLRASLEKKYAPKILKHAKGIIGVSPEIVECEKQKSGNVPARAFANGITVADIKHTGFVPFDGKTLNIVMPFAHELFFHGVDRIIKSVENYTGKVDIKLHLLGRWHSRQYTDNKRVIYYGTLKGDDYNNLMAKMNIGMGTFALYRRREQQASPLKIRDFTARGLPFILAYDDICFDENPQEMPFYKQFPNNADPIDFNEVIKFAEYISSSPVKDKISDYMRNYASKYLDWSIIMKKYIDFVKQIDGDNGTEII